MAFYMNILLIIQIIISIALIGIIALQAKESSLGSAFGSSGNSFHTKQASEKFVFIFTVILSLLFIALAIINITF